MNPNPCSICGESIATRYELLCGHSFHEDCITRVMRDQGMCPECKDSLGEPCGSGYELFHLMDNLQCRVCHWKPIKKVTFQPVILKVEYRLNHHCEFCQLNCYLSTREPHYRFLESLLRDFEPKDDSFVDMGRQWLNDNEIRPYNQYDYLLCKYCHRYVTEFVKRDVASCVKETPDEIIGHGHCPDCFNLTWGTLLDQTYQVLPRCFACRKVVENRERFRRECCRVRGSKVVYHFDCSRNLIKCLNCQKKCKMAFSISKSDPTLQEVKLLGKALMKESDENGNISHGE